MQTFIHDVALHLAAPPFGHCSLLGRQLAAFQLFQAIVHESGQNLGLGGCFGQLEAGVLEIHDALAEGLALAHVVERDFERALCRAYGRNSQQKTFPRQLLHQLVEALPFLVAQEVGQRNTHIREVQFRRVVALHPHLVELATDGKAFQILRLDNDQ